MNTYCLDLRLYGGFEKTLRRNPWTAKYQNRCSILELEYQSIIKYLVLFLGHLYVLHQLEWDRDCSIRIELSLGLLFPILLTNFLNISVSIKNLATIATEEKAILQNVP